MADLSQHYRVIKRPLFTEKVTNMQERANTFSFEVDIDANKVQIRQAIEAIFEVKVVKVRTQRVPSKVKRIGFTQGHTPPWKKAFVTLAEGQSIHQL